MSAVVTMEKYKPYPTYKDSGIEWLGQVPEGWSVTSLKNLLDVRDGTHDTPEYVDVSESSFPLITSKDITSGELNFLSAKHISEKDYQSISMRSGVAENDILMPMIGTVGSPVVVNSKVQFAIKNVALFRTSVSKKISSSFLYYFLNSSECENQFGLDARGGVQNFVALGTLRNLKLPLVTLESQTQIANFLDRETRKIDTLIEKQQTLIELLKEKRQAVISHAVTKGLNPNAKMKNSGIEWLGNIPEHWKVSSLKYMFSNFDFRRIPISSSDREHMSGEYPYYGASGIIDYVNNFIFDEETVLVGEDGANLVMRSTPLAFVAKDKYWVNNHAHILKFYDGLSSFWIHVINNLDIIPFVSGSAQPKLTAEALGNLIVTYPVNLEERKQIVQRLDTQTQKIDTLIDKSQQAIELLKERKTALISAAVTGKIDVRGMLL